MNKLNPIVIELLRKRGVTEKQDIMEFISPSPRRTYDPFLMLNMERAADIILESISSDKKICIYGDYDADGITSVAILMQSLRKLTDNVFYYIPSRFIEGYGLNTEAIHNIKEKGADLIITVDCGSVSYNEIEYAKEQGIEVIVTDHHNIDERAADCLIVNPKQELCGYPFKELAGCGVAFKLVCALQRKLELDKSFIRDVLDLVAIGTIGDIVPLVDENRTLVKYGLKALRSTKRKGLLKLLEMMALRPATLNADNIAYVLVPHLNAAGRMRDASLCVEILLSDNDRLIHNGAEELIRCNRERRKAQDEAYDKCVDIVEKHLKNRNFIMIKCLDAHEGITGIVAGKLKDRYKRPVAIVTPTADGLKGTGRSVSRLNLYDIMKNHEEYLDKFGGHAAACGFTMADDKFRELSCSLDDTVAHMLEQDSTIFDEGINIDMELTVDQITLELFNDVQLIGPFGHKNRKPVFAVRNIVARDVFYMGNDKKHVKFNGFDAYGNYVRCILFNKAQENKDIIRENNTVTVTGCLDEQVWRNTREVQIIINSVE